MFRDEMANLVWAVEEIVADQLGNPVASAPSRMSEAPPHGGTTTLSYRAQTLVPANWIPFEAVRVPASAEDQGGRRWRLAELTDESGELVHPRSVLLNELVSSGSPWVFEEEILRDGLTVEAVPRLARLSSGRYVSWMARRRRVGKGEGRSGLRFDVLERR